MIWQIINIEKYEEKYIEKKPYQIEFIHAE